jgi:Ca-activated chloride channel homolog
MRFLTPIGLFGLIGIILLILIYVLKPKYQEKSVSSTFVWKLSLKYKKQKMPFQWLKSSLLVILQFAILSLLTLALTTPLFALNTHSGEKIIILDSSANMMVESGGRTRFERAIDEIGALAERTTPDDRFTVILAGKEATFIARRLDSAKFIKQLLSELSPTLADANISSAVSLTEGVLAENPNAEVILFTGVSYSEYGNIKIRDMSRNEWNVAILDFSAKLQNGYYTFTAEVASFNRDSNVVATIYIDDEMRDVKTVVSNNNEIVTITWNSLYVINFDKAEVVVEYEDDFSYDNSYTIYGWENELFTVQLVSENPRFLQAALLTIGNYKIDIPVAPDTESPIPVKYEGYDLYIFDSFLPEHLPVDGSIWLINPPDAPTGLGFSVGPIINGDYTLSANDELTNHEEAILDLVRPSNITVSRYSFISHDDTFEEILYIDSDPVVLTKDLDGQKLVVFAFSLHHSNLPIIPDYILLTHNLSRFSVQNMVSSYLFHVGDLIEVRKKSSALQMTVSYDEHEHLYDNFPVSFIAEQQGNYKITQSLASGEQVSVDFFVRIAKNQSNFDHDFGTLSNPVISNPGNNIDANQDTLDIIYILMGLIIVLLLIEWGLHYNEHN